MASRREVSVVATTEDVSTWAKSLAYMPGWTLEWIEPAFPDPSVVGFLRVHAVVPDSRMLIVEEVNTVVATGVVIYQWMLDWGMPWIVSQVEEALDRLHQHERKEWLKSNGVHVSTPHHPDGSFA